MIPTPAARVEVRSDRSSPDDCPFLLPPSAAAWDCARRSTFAASVSLHNSFTSTAHALFRSPPSCAKFCGRSASTPCGAVEFLYLVCQSCMLSVRPWFCASWTRARNGRRPGASIHRPASCSGPRPSGDMVPALEFCMLCQVLDAISSRSGSFCAWLVWMA